VPRLLLSAAHKSSGKTTIATGLCAALAQRGYRVQPFKKGPDYIDPLWLGRAAGRPCVNLDFNTMDHAEIRQNFACRLAPNDIAIVEANKGLYDGLALDGSNSNAALTRVLETPVVLIIDCRGMTRGIAPLLLGYQAFGPDLHFAGVILNRVGGTRHASKLRAAVEHYTEFKVLGVVQEDASLQIEERHLGLVPSNEHGGADKQIGYLAQRIAEQVDWQTIATIGADLPALACAPAPPVSAHPHRVVLAVARDAAFGFYYSTDLEALERAGAELVFFDTLRDQNLPSGIDGLFIGGGFPETQMDALAANTAMRAEIRAAITGGLPAYAECGGLMYLARSIRWGDRIREMVGVLPGTISLSERPFGKGYVRLQETGRSLWPQAEDDSSDAPHSLERASSPGSGGTNPRLGGADSPVSANNPQSINGPTSADTTNADSGEFAAHEFHYSRYEPAPGETPVYAYRVLRGYGIDGHHDGIIQHNLLANYCHLQHTRKHPWAERFVAFLRAQRTQHKNTR